MKYINTVIVVVGILCCLVHAVPAQTPVNLIDQGGIVLGAEIHSLSEIDPL